MSYMPEADVYGIYLHLIILIICVFPCRTDSTAGHLTAHGGSRAPWLAEAMNPAVPLIKDQAFYVAPYSKEVPFNHYKIPFIRTPDWWYELLLGVI